MSRSKKQQPEPKTEGQHFHRWRIEEPDGPVSLGICDCGTEKTFKNWLSDSDFITNEEHRVMAA